MPRRALDSNPDMRLAQARTTEDLIEIMRDEEELKKRQTILKDMSPQLRIEYEWIRDWLYKEFKSVLESRYELGEHVLKIFLDDTQNGAKVYGRRAIEKICTVLDWDDGMIRACLRFVQTFTREDLRRLCSLVLPRGEPLSWSHVRCLLQVQEPERRETLLQQTLQEGLTCTELAYEVKHLADPRGRPVKIPTSFDGVAQQQKQFIDSWEKRYPKVWSGSEQSFTMRAAQLAPQEVTEERLREAAELAHRLRQMADQALQAAEKAEEVVHTFERLLAERKVPSLVAQPPTEEQKPEKPPAQKRSRPSASKPKTPRAATQGRESGRRRGHAQ